MVAWDDFERAAPDIARAGRRLLEEADGRPAVAFLATVGDDGRPRMHPFIPAIVDGALWAFVTPSPKQGDLDRAGLYAIHSTLGPADESFFLSGTARRVDDAARRAAVATRMPYNDDVDDHACFEFGVDRVLWTTWTTPTTPQFHRWRAG